jgi:hypothetical protein
LFDSSELKILLSRQDISRKTKVLAILTIDRDKPKSVSEIKVIAELYGLRGIKNWNLSQVLSAASEMVIRLSNGWEITDLGIQFILDQGLASASPIKQNQSLLRKYTTAINPGNAKFFVEECIVALETGLLRSAVTLSWIGAISLLYEEVLSGHLANFNMELQKRHPKHKQIKSLDEFATIKEHEFLQIINAISIIGKNVKQELEQCLQLRNACAHPNSLSIGEMRVASHLEILTLNIYQRFIV